MNTDRVVSTHEPGPTSPRRRIASALAAVALLSAQHGVAAEPLVYRIDECAQPLTLELHGVSMAGDFPLESTLDICSERGTREMQLKYPEEPAPSFAGEVHPPEITWLRRDGKLDVRVELRDQTPVRIYERAQIAAGTRQAALRRVGHEDGPALAVSLRPLGGPAVVGIHAESVSVGKVMADLVRIKKLKVRHAERINDQHIRFDIESIRVDSLLELLADVSGVILHRDRDGGYLIGSNPHLQEINDLRRQAMDLKSRDDRTALKQALLRIVELAAPTVEGEPGVPVGDELEQLAEMAMDENDPVRAEGYLRTRLLEIEHSEHGVHRPEYARALADLALARLGQGDLGEAHLMLERALAILSSSDPGDSLDRARVLADLGGLEIELRRVAVAVEHADRAWRIVAGTTAEVARGQSLRMLRARLALDRLEVELARVFTEREDHGAAGVHLERALELAEAMWGVDDDLTLSPRQGLTLNAWRIGKPERAAKTHLDRIGAARDSGEAPSAVLLGSLGNLAAIRAGEGNTGEAVALGSRYVKAVGVASAATSPRMQAAQRFLVLLLRLDRKFEAADTLKRSLPQPAGSRPGPVGPLRPLEYAEIFDTALTTQLAIHFDRQLDAMAKASTQDEALRAGLQEKAAEAYASIGDERMATRRWQEALATLHRSKGPNDAQTLRVAKRLTALHERAGPVAGVESVRRELDRQ